jgi:mannose-6-phosphate isomerase-like protein (cupin superfamily)
VDKEYSNQLDKNRSEVMDSNRTIVNAFTGEQITFLKTSQETNGKYILIKVYLPSHSEGPPLHYHLAFDELFEVIEGELTVQVGVEKSILREQEQLLVEKEVHHRFSNESDQPVTFFVTLTPGSQFEESMRIGYGLIADGKTNKKGIPKNIFHLAMLLKMQDTNLADMPSFVQKVIFGNAASIGKRMGMDKSLEKYL